MSEDNIKQGDRFPTTHWTLVGRAGGGASEGAAAVALGELLTRYRPALRAHLLYTKRIQEHDADDLLQSFLSAKFLEQNLADTASRARGKFRTLVLTSLDRFIVSEQRKQAALKRAPDRAAQLNDDQCGGQTRDGDGPLTSFNLEWARQLMGDVIRSVRNECESSGRPDLWGVLESRVLDPILKGSEPVGYSELVSRFGLDTPTQAANALVTAKRMFQRQLRAVIGEYAASDEEVDAEIQDLHHILAG